MNIPSDHAPITVTLGNFNQLPSEILTRSKSLGYIDRGSESESICRPGVPSCSINLSLLHENIPSVESIWQCDDFTRDIDTLCDKITEELYNASKQAKLFSNTRNNNGVSRLCDSHTRWSKIMDIKDPKLLWQSIDWSGSFDLPNDVQDHPSDRQFCEHYEQLLSKTSNAESLYMPTRNVYIPVLDREISPCEVDLAIRKLKANKACGYDGLSPFVVKQLNDDWILLITFMFNKIFNEGYPQTWIYAKVFNIFKKGDRMNPGNYRGISIMPALAKLYDTILADRFSLWYQPNLEQAGSQKGRGCEEQVLVLRRVIDIARKTKQPLYIAYVDYQKAYDLVDRNKLLKILENRGCGLRFLRALRESLLFSTGIVGKETFKAKSGVRQGATTSCPLFTFFIDSTIDAVTSAGPDSWLGNLHCILFMDDTAVLASSREKLLQKVILLKKCTDDLGMVMHPTKSQYMTVNSNDNLPLHVDNIIVNHTENYTYLGTFISNASLPSQIKTHAEKKASHVIKFSSFLQKNSEAPFTIKKTVWNSVVNSALLYSCETWLCESFPGVESMYMSTIKQLLNARVTTCNDLVLLELGVGNIKSVIRDRQSRFIHKLIRRDSYNSSYLEWAIKTSMQVKSPMSKILEYHINSTKTSSGQSHSDESLTNLRVKVRGSVKTKYITYLEINPELSVCPLYSKQIPEYARISATRLRLSSHNLRIETGRWARIQREDRLCSCGNLQTEEHVLLYCERTAALRSELPIMSSFNNAQQVLSFTFPEHNTNVSVCLYCHKVLKEFY